MSRTLFCALAVALFDLLIFAPTMGQESAQVDADQEDIAANLPELILDATAKQEKKYRRKAEKAVLNRQKREVYIRYRIVNLNADALTKRDPLPLRNQDESVDVAWSFEMRFTPFEGESYVLRNHSSYKDEFSGIANVKWVGDIHDLAGDKIGGYVISDVRGDYGFTRFIFDNQEMYTIGRLKAGKTAIMFQEKLPF